MTKATILRINQVAARFASLPPDKTGEAARDKAYVKNSTALDEGALVRRVATQSGR